MLVLPLLVPNQGSLETIMNAIITLKKERVSVPFSTAKSSIVVNDRKLDLEEKQYDQKSLLRFVQAGIPPKSNHFYVTDRCLKPHVYRLAYPKKTTYEPLEVLYSLALLDLCKQKEEMDGRRVSFSSLGIDATKLHEDVERLRKRAKMLPDKEDLIREIQESEDRYLLEFSSFLAQFEMTVNKEATIDLKKYREVASSFQELHWKKLDPFFGYEEIAKNNTAIYRDLSRFHKMLTGSSLHLISIPSSCEEEKRNRYVKTVKEVA